MPYPPDKGERIRAFQELKALSTNFRITLATLAHSKDDYKAVGAISQWCERVIIAPAGGKMGLVRGALGITRGKSITEGYFYSRSLVSQLKEITNQKNFSIAFASSSSMLPYLLKTNVDCRVIDLVDVDSAKWFAYADEASRLKKWLYQSEGQGVSRLEQDAIVNCDAVLLVSEAESKTLGEYPRKVKVLGNGVDTDYFKPRVNAKTNSPSLVFTGTMDYRPNIEGVCWFVDKVWPELKQHIPDLTFCIVGRNPTKAVQQLAMNEGVEVTGTVADVRPYLTSADIAICPLHIARGVQNKVLEAMAMARPVISTTAGLEGLDVQVDHDVLRADTSREWCDSIMLLLRDESLRSELERNARICVKNKYNWESRMADLVELCQNLCDQQKQPDVTTTRQNDALVQQPQGTSKTEPQGDWKKLPTLQNVGPSAKKWRWPSNWKEKALWMITLAYIAFVTVVSLTPMEDNGDGWLDGISSPMLNFLHIPAYSGLMVLVTLAMCASVKHRLVGIILAAVCCCGFGVLMEYAQGMVPGRVVHLSDMMGNAAGVMIISPVMVMWLWRPVSRYDK